MPCAAEGPHAPLEDLSLDACREPLALGGWIIEVLYCDRKGRRAFLRVLANLAVEAVNKKAIARKGGIEVVVAGIGATRRPQGFSRRDVGRFGSLQPTAARTGRRLSRLCLPWRVSSTGEYRGTSLIRNSAPPGRYSRTMPRVLRWDFV
jgi:hypothetical protein